MNYRFNIDDWLPNLPLQERYGHYSGEDITGPWEICQNEQLRREMQEEFDWGPAVPVDVFIMADGEPTDRHITKIGGLPYRPANAAWPTHQDGKPLIFLAQFNFSDSKDITGELPGDLLLVFVDSLDCPEILHLGWQRLGLQELVSSADLPGSPRALAPCYGHIFRTVSFPKAERRDKSSKYPQCRGKDVWSSHLLLQYQASQIGTAPFFIQEGDSRLPGRPLCTISSVQPQQHTPYPWVNHAEPLLPEGKWDFSEDNYLMLGDVGCIYISIDDEGLLRWCWSCY